MADQKKGGPPTLPPDKPSFTPGVFVPFDEWCEIKKGMRELNETVEKLRYSMKPGEMMWIMDESGLFLLKKIPLIG